MTRASLSLLCLLLAASALAQTPAPPPAQVVLVRLSDSSLHKTAEAAFRSTLLIIPTLRDALHVDSSTRSLVL